MLKLPETPSCYFCEIIEGRADSWSVIERTESTLTLLNGRQFEIGQCLVVPVRHAPTLLDLGGEEAAAVMAAAKRLAVEFVALYDPDGILLYQNNGVGSGQEVPHFHLHVVPRREGSDWGLGPPHIARLEAAERSAQFDYLAVTDAKRATVERLRTRYRARSP